MKLPVKKFAAPMVLLLLLSTGCAAANADVTHVSQKKKSNKPLIRSLKKDLKYIDSHWSQEEKDHFYKKFVFDFNSLVIDSLSHP
jgi:Tfp pilus assembly protein PilP